MGYTHFYNRPKELDKAKFKLAVDDCKKLCDALPIPLGGADGTGEPILNDDLLEFNGSKDSQSFCRSDMRVPWPDDDAEGVSIVGDEEPKVGRWYAGDIIKSRCVDENGDGSFETFRIERVVDPKDLQDEGEDKYLEFCKTAFRPYDLNAQCCLIIFKQFFGADFLVSTDSVDKLWNEARDACQCILGYGLDFVLDKK